MSESESKPVRVFVYSGITGAGKSTIVRQRHKRAAVLSTDDFFTDQDGNYNFDPMKLGEAHAWCLRRFVEMVRDLAHGFYPGSRDEVVVDNTNTTIAELAPYAAVALAYGCELQIVTVQCNVEVAASRATHGAPRNVIDMMAAALAKRELPPWWRHEVVLGGGQ